MRSFVALLALLASCCAPPSTIFHTADLGPDWPSRVLAVSVVLMRDEGPYCGATFVGPNTLVTAAHCLGVDPEPEQQVRYTAFAPRVLRTAVVRSLDLTNDLALLRTKEAHPYVRIQSALPRLGEAVVNCGAPGGVAFMLGRGIVGKIPNGENFIWTTTGIWFGSSGGGLFSSSGGVLIGVASFMAERQSFLGGYIRGQYVAELLARGLP